MTRESKVVIALALATPVTAVSQRVGHAKASMTLDIYSHVLTAGQRSVADTVATVLYG
jgi:integrase